MTGMLFFKNNHGAPFKDLHRCMSHPLNIQSSHGVHGHNGMVRVGNEGGVENGFNTRKFNNGAWGCDGGIDCLNDGNNG